MCLNKSYLSRVVHRYQTCFHHVLPKDLVDSKLLLPEGMSEFAKATPPSTHKSHMHQIVHYPRCVHKLGPLNGCTMLSDERRNKVRTETSPENPFFVS